MSVETVSCQFFSNFLYLCVALSVPRKYAFFKIVFCMHTVVLSACMSVCAVPMEDKKGCWVLWNWSYRWLWAAMCVLGTKLRPPGKIASALNYWAISPASKIRVLISHFDGKLSISPHKWPRTHDLLWDYLNANEFRISIYLSWNFNQDLFIFSV